ncbi:AAA family ATPase [Photobacterium leiognathi]|uniref:AAA family ATPase n=1 Tax=Photobacterium leiognathi TaxID=553611 RepID=UPI00298217EA|nr:AAA family ATPase [Photobacterium leiognathi]
MMQYKPFLLVKRLVITKGKSIAYDEQFTAGVNIIRGVNSSGKSTISDFIFYGLGGDLTKLKNEAKQCSFVFLEASLSGKVFTLKREIAEGGRKGMDIFSGGYEAASVAAVTDWTRHPYNANTKESFYQALFKELGMPYSKSDDKNSITMHQLLRMLYVDQMTSPDRLFKFDKFDSPNKRQAIGELLIGLSDFELYEKRVRIQSLKLALENRIKEIKTIHSFLGGTIKSVSEIDSEIEEKRKEIDTLELEVESFSSSSEDGCTEDEVLKNLLVEIEDARGKYTANQQEIAKTSFEITDSQMFIESLSRRIKALKETQDTINALSDVAFNHCPACQTEVQVNPAGCSLCGVTKPESENSIDPTFKVRKEIEFQIAESILLIEKKQIKLDELRVKSNQLETKLGELERDLKIIRKPQRVVSIQLRQKLSKIGGLCNEIKALNNSKEEFAKLYGLYDERDILQTDFNTLSDEIARLTQRMENELKAKKRKLSEATLSILKADAGHEEIFVDGRKVEFDFADDRVTIDDRALFSASSMVYLKNAFRLAMLKCSCEDSSYLYPRFLLMDNIEDKGMEEERSQLFQREIVKLSNSLDVEHQIIFTTSMIDSNLNYSEYCVGDFYNMHNKTLKV